VWPQLQPVGTGVLAGLALVVLALALFGAGSSGAQAAAGVSRRWAMWVTAGWLLSGLSMTGQYVGSVLAADSPLALTTAFYTVAALILLPLMARRRQAWLNRVELAGGLVNGVLSAAALVTTLLALQHARAEIVFPVTVAMPILLVLALSAAVYRERLSRMAWLACLAGVAGLVVLSLNS
jgi:drug/metabolite transporter (DMT)-like permease